MKPHFSSVVFMLLLMLVSGCSQFRFPALAPTYDATLTLNVFPAEAPGHYQLIGETNLPSGTRIAVAALRFLHPQQANPQQSSLAHTKSLNHDSTFSILDYREVEVDSGQWQAHLKLWQVAQDGRFQEAWQRESVELVNLVTPDSQVVFVAMLAPINLPDLEKQLVRDRLRLTSDLLQITQEGDRYLKVSRSLAIALPTGRTTATPPPEPINGGWGRRYLILPEPPNTIQLERPTQRQTTAPITPDEVLR